MCHLTIKDYEYAKGGSKYQVGKCPGNSTSWRRSEARSGGVVNGGVVVVCILCICLNALAMGKVFDFGKVVVCLNGEHEETAEEGDKHPFVKLIERKLYGREVRVEIAHKHI